MLIDDNSELRHYVKSRLQTVYNIEEADDGATGLRLAFEIVPDLIICDVMLPGKDGFEVVKTVKEDLRTSHIRRSSLQPKARSSNELLGFSQELMNISRNHLCWNIFMKGIRRRSEAGNS